MLKKLLKFVGLLLLLGVLSIGAFVGWWKYQSVKYDETAVPYLNRTIAEIAHWDKDVARTFMAPAALKGVSEEDYSKIFNWYKKLGALKKLDRPVLTNIFTGVTVEGGASKILTYAIRGEFEAGEALITVRLLDLGTEFKILFLNINSKALIGGV